MTSRNLHQQQVQQVGQGDIGYFVVVQIVSRAVGRPSDTVLEHRQQWQQEYSSITETENNQIQNECQCKEKGTRCSIGNIIN